jgi:hypothetical protein
MSENELVCDPVMLNATERVAVYYDQFADDPRRDWYSGVSMFPIENNDRFDTLLPGDDDGMISLLSDVFAGGDWDEDTDDKEQMYVALLNEHNRVWIKKEFTSYRDWVGNYLVWTAPAENAKEYLNSYCNTIQQWIDGEVYVVALEKMRTYVDESDPERTITRWEIEESVGSVYLDNFNDESILEVAGYTVGDREEVKNA